ncbi:DUF6340 family protein [Aliiglaciecola litoralis]|uniref:Uncharacterized protein n=1 Tax=Aliiglaciecola litoralis TaxID=582857 RepID=A0ABN1LRE4_9ALTE
MQKMAKTLGRSLLIILSFVLFSGCASKIEVDSLMNMPSESGLSLNQLAIKGFKGNRYGITNNVLSAKIKAGLMHQGYIKIYAGSPYILVGEISPSRVERKTWREKHEGKKETWYSYHASVKQTLTVSYSVIYRSQTLTSGSETFSYSKEKDSYDSYTKAKERLRSNEEIADILTDQAAEYIVKQISPYKAKVKLSYLTGDDENIDLGIEYVKKGRLKQAYSIFGQVAQNTGSIEDQAIALHNQGLIKLMQGKHADSFELMSRANLIDPRNLDILDSMKEVENYKVLNDAHKSQTGR